MSFNPSSPGVYAVFDPDTLTSIERPFTDDLKLDYASLTPTLDPDGVSFNRKLYRSKF